MTRRFIAAAAQLGPIGRHEPRGAAVARLSEMMRAAAGRGARLVVFPELALTTFFPRWYLEDDVALDPWFETEMPSPETRPLFDLSAELGVAFHLGYAEKTPEGRRFNTAILVDRGEILLKYRKIHLPGHREHEPVGFL